MPAWYVKDHLFLCSIMIESDEDLTKHCYTKSLDFCLYLIDALAVKLDKHDC